MDASLAAVLANPELALRTARNPDRCADDRALSDLAGALATAPDRILQRLADYALQLCWAQSAGVSLLEEKGGKEIFRWHAVAGAWSHYLWTTLPRHFSPCGTVLDLDEAQLMLRPARHFTVLDAMTPQVSEVLLVPFKVGGRTVGALWVIAHEEWRQFDMEDHRVMTSLAAFAAKAYRRLEQVRGLIIALPAGKPRPAASFSSGPPPACRKILIVSEATDFADSVTLLLRETDHEVLVAADCAGAVELAGANQPDVVFLDLEMLDANGIEVAAQLRKRAGAQARLVAFNAFGSETSLRDDMAMGFDHHIVEPIDPAFLARIVA